MGGAIKVDCRICHGPTGGNHGYFMGACHRCVQYALLQQEKATHGKVRRLKVHAAPPFLPADMGETTYQGDGTYGEA